MKLKGLIIGGVVGFIPGACLGCLGQINWGHGRDGNFLMGAIGGGVIAAMLGAFFGVLFAVGHRK